MLKANECLTCVVKLEDELELLAFQSNKDYYLKVGPVP